MKTELKLSLIVPTYSCSAYIRECLDSVLGQLPPACELIAVDDGSADDTREILRQYAGRHDCLKAVFRPHAGASAARNAGLDNAEGEFVAFLDCDDCIRPGFLPKAVAATDPDTDLYIFGIERIPLQGDRALWTVTDNVYESAARFAEAYIRLRGLLLYSNCNKLYRRSVIEAAHIRFREDLCFGEDRIFNFDYLGKCGRIATSSAVMLSYIQRSEMSMSNRHFPGYYPTIAYLHQAKIRCILGLARDVSAAEKTEFILHDSQMEIRNALARFTEHPDERDENLPLITQDVFGGPYDEEIPLDVIIIAGSTHCGYKVEKGYEIGRKNPGVRYIVSGGNRYCDGVRTESEFMADFLREKGVRDEDVYLENRAVNSYENMKLSAEIIQSIRKNDSGKKAVAVITGGFHLRRLLQIASATAALKGEQVIGIPAYGPHTGPDHWYKNELGKSIVMEELKKLDLLSLYPDLWSDQKEA